MTDSDYQYLLQAYNVLITGRTEMARVMLAKLLGLELEE